jgi:hypothetical protein
MRMIGLHAALLAASVLICANVAHAQNSAQTVEGLRAQLADVEAKETELQARLKQLDEEMLPENIERSLALTGSTRPEELREQRRRQLEAEKARVQAQLDLLAASHTRLETAITTAQTAEAARQTIGTTTIDTTTTTVTTLTTRNSIPASITLRAKRRSSVRRHRTVHRRRRSAQRRHR